MVYDLIYDDNGKIVNALLINGIHGKGQHYIKTKIPTSISVGNKINFGNSNHFLYYNSKLNTDYDDGLIEGCINLVNIKSSSGWKNIATKSKKNEYSILRFINHDENGNAILNYQGSEYSDSTHDNEKIYLLDKSKERLKHNRIYIEKTVDVHTDDVVVANDELTYTILIKNNSNKNYIDDIVVTENISDYVKYKKYETNKEDVIFKEDLDNKKIKWNIGKLNSGEEVIIKYSVKVREYCYGKTIESTGTVGNIPSSIIKNKIGNKLTEVQENNVQKKYDELKSKYVGKELVNEIYKEALGIDLKFNEFDITNLVKNTKMASISATTAVLNKDDSFYDFVLNKYWSTLYRKSNNYQSQGDVIAYDLKDWQEYDDENRRADTIYGENFKTGDILIYKNNNDVLYNFDDDNLTTTPVTYEDGEYAYIYIEGRGFVGVNYGNDGIAGTKDDRNEFTPKYYSNYGLSVYSNTSEIDEEILNFANYQTLFGKDYYCILRPAMAVDIVSMKSEIYYNNNNLTSQDVIENIDKTLNTNQYKTMPKTITLSKTAFTYNKKVQKPKVIIKDSKGDTIDSSNYTVTYSNKKSKKVGKYTVIIIFKGNYTGTKKLTYKINPKGTKIRKITAGRKRFKVTWKKQKTQISGYEVQYSTNKKFKSRNKKVKIKKNKTTSTTVKKLKLKKKYYVRIRTYKTVNGKKFYSRWSKILNVRTK